VIVCSCNVISDRQVRTVTAEHALRATREVYRCLGCTAECGRCVQTIRKIMDEARADTAPSVASPSIAASSDEPPLCPLLFAAQSV
jgi:bacterioferritin-associated ferredoxin